MADLNSSICLTSVNASVLKLAGIGVPEAVASPNPVITALAEKKLGGKPVDRAVLYFAQAIPSGTTTTLPIVFTSEGRNVQPLTKIGGVAVTAADITGSGIYIAWFDHSSSTLQLLTGVV